MIAAPVVLTTMGLALILAALHFYNSYVPTNELQIKTSHGWIEGGYTTTRGGRKVMQFLGIPYAKAPVKLLSFKASTSSKLPVIFFIHGGAYMGLSAAKSFYGPEMMLDKDVVLVTVNYRLGVLGFLTTEDSVIPGNWAMKDQAAALRWVKRNIHEFGGDPNSITLMGQDTGAGSVHLHMHSPLTKDLFHRGVIHSGSGLCLWGFSEPGVLKGRSKKVAELIGCPFEPSEEFLECLQKTESKKIIDTTRNLLVWENDPFAMWNPVIEGADVEGAFLVQNPHTMTSTKPILAGYNYAEGTFKTAGLIEVDENRSKKLSEWHKDIARIAPVSLLYDTKAPNPSEITRRVQDFYLQDVLWGVMAMDFPNFNRMFGDFWFTNGLLDAVEKHSGPKYLYHFNFNTTASICSIMHRTKYYGGACHFDELMYLFPMDIKNNYEFFMELYTSEYKLSLKMVELWTSFATNSVPTASGITWDPVKTSALEHLEITKSEFSMKNNPITDRREFWKSLQLNK